MPRRRQPDPLALRIGKRIRAFRREAGLSLEKLAYESELGSKGHLSDVERGLTRPTVTTLKVLADRLGVALLDLVTFPEEDDRQRLVEELRQMPPDELSDLARRYAPSLEEQEVGIVVGEQGPDRGDKILAELGGRVRDARVAAGRSAASTAARAGLPLQRLLAIEEGKADVSVRTLERIARALDTTFWNLLER